MEVNVDNDNFFNLDALAGGIDRNLAPGIDTTIFSGDLAMISVVRFEPGSKGEIHSHPEEQWGLCQSGTGVRIQDGKRVHVAAGDFWLTPGGIKHGMEAGEKGLVVVDIFAPPRGSYKTEGSGFSAAEK